MERATKLLEQSGGFVITKSVLDEVLKLEEPVPKPVLTGKKEFRPLASEVEAQVEVLLDPTKRISSGGDVQHFLHLFRDRFEKIQKIFRRQMTTRDAITIDQAHRSPDGTRLKFICMIREKRETKKAVVFEVEDLESSARVIALKESKELYEKASRVVVDEVVCVECVKRGEVFVARDFILPEIPHHTPRRAETSVSALLISDFHIGSRMFMEKEVRHLVGWLRGRVGSGFEKKIAESVKYVVVAGDLVDGIGVYPGQEDELEVISIYEQYEKAAEILSEIPEYVEIVIIPGNHDATRQALPQPAISQSYAKKLYELHNVRMLGNPCVVRLHEVEILVFHGQSMEDLAFSVPGMAVDKPEKTQAYMLRARHLAPVYGQKTPIAPELEDILVVESVPDVFHAGHVHVTGMDRYRGVLILNSGAWQTQTPYQVRKGLTPTPGRSPIVNLATLEVTWVGFG